MAVDGIQWFWFSGSGSGYHTADINIAPSTLGACATLHGKSGGGIAIAGIKSYRRRLSSGADQNVDFGEWPSWPYAIFDHVSSVTYGVATGANQQGWVGLRFDHWR
jgi:hypothetical protein